MTIQLSDHFTYSKLLRFTIPSIIMVIFISIYSVIDGIFVAKFVGSTQFAAVNIVWPFILILGSIGFMFGSGGSALVAKTLGEAHHYKANRIFSLLIYTVIFLGITLGTLGFFTIEKMLKSFGIEGQLLKNCIIYADILMPAVPVLMLQVIFHTFLVTAERPKFGLIITIAAGVVNFVLDALFILVFKWGLAGAALATAASQIIGGLIPLFYFILPNKSPLHLGYTKFNPRVLIKAATNGLSEFMSNISMSIVGIVYNYQMLRLIGESGVVAFGIISYVNFIFWATFLGYGTGSNPIVSFHYGAGNKDELKNLFNKSLHLIAIAAIILTTTAEICATEIAKIFVGYDADLTAMTAYGFRIYAISFLLAGFNIYASAFFTALNNGLVSATISFCRTLVFECLCVMILPIFFGLNGIWSAIIFAEIMALIVSVYFFIGLKKRYGY